MEPLYVRVDERDNVAVVANPGGLPARVSFPCGLKLTEPVPQGHKVALTDLRKGDAIIRYGQIIGFARQPVPRGSRVHAETVELPDPPSLERLPMATAACPHLPPLEDYVFDGYRNADGSVGTKNALGIVTTVQCVAPVAEFAVRRIKAEILPRFRNVDDVIAITHSYGCGVAIDAPGAGIPVRTLRNLSLNPNFGARPLVLSLGCEKLQPSRLLPGEECMPPSGEHPQVIRIQDEEYKGFEQMIAAIMRASERELDRLNRRRRSPCPASDLIVGLQCGGSDAFSGVTANPAVGYAADLLVRSGATVMFSEVSEVRDAIHLLTPRAASTEVAEALVREMSWYDDYLKQGGVDRSANPTPGNKRGGLSNIVEKALGSVAKAGTTAIRAVAGPGERVTSKGLVFAATPASDFLCGTLQLAASMNMHIFTTGEGTPYGLALAPVIKVASQTALAQRWPDLIDVDAGRIATGQATIEQVGWEIFRLVLDVASGRKKTWADHWGLHNSMALFNPGPVT